MFYDRTFSFDVDGTLTNGDITYSSSLEEFKTFNVNDGFAIVFGQNI